MFETDTATAPAASDARTIHSSLPPILAQQTDGDTTLSVPGHALRLPDPSCANESSLSFEQATPGLQAHLMAAEQRVFKNLRQVMQSMETRLGDALRQAAIDIIENLGKQAATCIYSSERKAALLSNELNYNKGQSLAMLMRLKQLTDAQISDAKAQILIEKQRAQEAEVKLCAAQQYNKKLKAELKQKGRLIEEFQRAFSQSNHQNLPLSSIERSENAKDVCRASGFEGQLFPLQTPSTSGDSGVPVASAGAASLRHYTNSVVDIQAREGLPYESAHSDEYQTGRAQVGMAEISDTQHGKNASQGKKDLPIAAKWDVRSTAVNSQRGSPPGSNTLRKEDCSEKVRHLVQSEGSYKGNKQDGALPLFVDVHPAALTADPELRSTNVSDEEKSCLTIEGIHGNNVSSLAEITPVEEYQSDENHDVTELPSASIQSTGILDGAFLSVGGSLNFEGAEKPKTNEEISSSSTRTAKASKGKDTGACRRLDKQPFPIRKEDVGRDGITTADTAITSDKSLSTLKSTSLELPSTIQEPRPENSPLSKSDLTDGFNNVLDEDDCRPGTRSESPRNQPLRKKRKQVVYSSKEKCWAGAKRSKGSEDDVISVAVDRQPTVGSDTPNTSRDDRRLMQGARQLFMMAERRR